MLVASYDGFMSIVEESQVRRITCDEFMRMFEAGVFAEGDRLELLDGFITEMSPQSPQHSLAVDQIFGAAQADKGYRTNRGFRCIAFCGHL